MTTAALVFAVVACVAIAAIGIVSSSYDRGDPRLRCPTRRCAALTAIKGVRDVTSGVVPLVVWAVAGVPALGWVLIAASITPWADMGIVLAAAADARPRSASTA